MPMSHPWSIIVLGHQLFAQPLYHIHQQTGQPLYQFTS